MGSIGDENRFWVKVNKDSPTGCWLWTACVYPCGYGQFMVGSRSDGTRRIVSAHRWLWEQEKGAIPKGLELHHICGTRCCVNVSHLVLVTRKEHISLDRSGDRHGSRRHPERVARGEQHGMAKINKSTATEIRNWYAFGWPKTQLSYAFLLSRRQIARIVRGDCW